MKVSIIGLGRVGSTLAYTLMLKELADELVLVNRTPEVAKGDALDLQHALMFVDQHIAIRAGGVAETAGSDVLAICASAPWKDGFNNRLDLAVANTRLMRELIPPLAAASPDAKILMLSNPVDVLTWHAIRLSGFEPSRVMGTGTIIDSSRFRELVGEQVGIHPADIRAYTMGEHGESQFVAFSRASAGGEPLEDRPDRREMVARATRAGLDVFDLKGCTNYAIAMAAAHVIDCIANDSRHTMPLSVLVDGYLGVSGVCLSVPVVVGRTGVARWMKPDLNDDEADAFRRSAAIIRKAIVDTLDDDRSV
ncbi:L-lactate dehydrogenase [Botrimarina colliarenosi]|uniref:L-lactate dehydrogenase n=1 Tax=Botrimarina colliarenosi TaxID=2528001 RepID=A0A5C6AMM3_9BACT|nr:lactate dehydrogenase [Botrimarina colliarenosi]TWU00252.1 L-lactate dehydrogenase [Botrimarina colliarenosi]